MGYVLYRGSRDELNEMCRVKDERIAELEAALQEIEAWVCIRSDGSLAYGNGIVAIIRKVMPLSKPAEK